MNTKALTVLAICLLACSISSVAIGAGGSVRGVVIDSSGAPLAKVKITLSGADFEFEKVATTNKKGRFTLAVSDAGREYIVKVEKEGFLTQEEPFEIPSGQVLDVEWQLYTEAEAVAQKEQIQALQAKDKATKAYNQGAESYNAEDVEGAIGHFREAIAANRNLELAHAALGRVLLEKERWSEARESAEAFLAVSPEQPLALQTLYDAYWGEGDKENAAKTLKRLLAVEPGPAVAARIFNQGVAATKAQDYEAAVEFFGRAHELDPNLYQALLPLAQIQFAKGEWQEAIDSAEQYLEHDIGNARANIVRYESYQKLGNQEAADSAFAELGQNSPKAAAEMFLRDGTNYFNEGSNAEAIQAVETSIELDPANPDAHHRLGLCYASAGQNAKARAAFEKFLELAPDHPEAASVRDMLNYLN